MQFIAFAIISAFLFALTFLLRKNAGQLIPLTTAYFIETCVQMLIVLLLFGVMLFQTRQRIDLHNKGVLFAALAGLTVVIAVALNYAALKTGLLSKVVGITSPAQILFGVLLGLIIFRESLTSTQILGTILSIAGIVLILQK